MSDKNNGWSQPEEKFPETIMRLEVEEDNTRAVAVYQKNGYETLPYMEMKKEI